MSEYNEASQNYNESLEKLLQAIDVIAGSKLNDISCDKTEICTIQGKKNDAVNTNTYMVSNGSLQFEAVVDAPLGSKDAPKYKKDDSVRVLIPNGNYKETKYITGLYTVDINNPTAYISPSDGILDITGNLFARNATLVAGLTANREDETLIQIGDDINFLDDTMYYNNYKAYDTIVLSAKFKSLLSSYNVISGSYGLKLELYQEQENEDGGLPEKVLQYTIILDSSDMLGNPYLFQTDSIQSIKFAIPNLENRLFMGRLYFYQKNNFNYLSSSGVKNKLPVQKIDKDYVKNLYVSNINLNLGVDMSKTEDNQFKIFTHGNTDYGKDISKNTYEYFRKIEERDEAREDARKAEQKYNEYKRTAERNDGVISKEEADELNRLEIIKSQAIQKYRNLSQEVSKFDYLRDFNSLWYNKDDNNKYIGFSDGIYDKEYDELEYRKQIAEEQRLQFQLNNATLETSTDVRGITLAANYKDITEIYNSIYKYLDIFMWNELNSFLSEIDNISNANLQDLVANIKGDTNDLSFSKNVKLFKNIYELMSNFYKQVLLYAKKWQTAENNEETKPVVQYGNEDGKIPPIPNRKTAYNLYDEASRFSVYIDIFKDYKNIIDEYTYNNYVTQMSGYFKKIEEYCLELLKYESAAYNDDTIDKYKDSKELEFYLGEKWIDYEEDEEDSRNEDYLKFKNYKFSKNLYKKDEEWHSQNANKYCIYWYKYNPEYENLNNEEQLVGIGWERLLVDKNGNSLINFGIPDKQEDNEYNQIYCKDNIFSLILDSNKITEKIVAVLFYNHTMYKSNIIEFTNLTPSSSTTNLDGINALSIIHGNNSKNVYQCYGIDNQAIKSSDVSITRYLKVQYEGTKGGNEQLIGAKVKWFIPKNSTMLSYNEDDLKKKVNGEEKDIYIKSKEDISDIYDIFIYEEVTGEINAVTGVVTLTEEGISFPYHIKNNYISSFSNNEIKCEVTLKDGEKLSTTILFTFATGEANGTNYAFIIAPATNVTHISSITMKDEDGNNKHDESRDVPLKLNINIFDGDNNNLIIDGTDITISASWLCCRYQNIKNNVNYNGGIDGSEEVYYRLEFDKDDKNNIIGCTVFPKKGWGGPAIVKFTANIKEEGATSQILTTYYTIPWCPSGHSYYLEGATSIIYNSLGTNPSRFTGPYKLFYNQNIYNDDNTMKHKKGSQVSNIHWKMRYYIFDNKVYQENGSINNEYGQSYIDLYDNGNDYYIDGNIVPVIKDYKLLLEYLPKLKKSVLQPAPMYIDGLLEDPGPDDETIEDQRANNLYPAILAYEEVEDIKDGKKIIKDHVLWIQPLLIMQNVYNSSFLNDWNGSLSIDEENNAIMSAMIGAGRKINKNGQPNTFEGILMGDLKEIDSSVRSLGLYGYHKGAQSFGFKVDGTAFIGKAGYGRIELDGNTATITSTNFDSTTSLITGTKIDLDDGKITTGNLHTSNIQASGGKIGGWTIQPTWIGDNESSGNNFYLASYKDEWDPDGDKVYVKCPYWLRATKNGEYIFSLDRDGNMFAKSLQITGANEEFDFRSDSFKLYTNGHSTLNDMEQAGFFISNKGFSFLKNGGTRRRFICIEEDDNYGYRMLFPYPDSIWLYTGTTNENGIHMYDTLTQYIKKVIDEYK